MMRVPPSLLAIRSPQQRGEVTRPRTSASVPSASSYDQAYLDGHTSPFLTKASHSTLPAGKRRSLSSLGTRCVCVCVCVCVCACVYVENVKERDCVHLSVCA